MSDFRLVDALVARGDVVAAMDLLREIVADAPDAWLARLRLGTMLLAHGDPVSAESVLAPLAARFPTDPEVAFRLANALAMQRRFEAAGAVLEAALEGGGERVDFLTLMGRICSQLGMVSPAIRCLERAVSLAPDNPDLLYDLGHLYIFDGRVAEAAEVCRRELAIRPDTLGPYSLLCWLSNHLPGLSAADVAAIHRAWGATMAMRAAVLDIEPFVPPSAPPARLRVGYLSADFRNHPVAAFLEPVLDHRDRARFEVWLISDTREPDAMTARLRAAADHWVDIAGLGHEAATRRIRAEKLDILVDLAGHTTDNRLTCFALRAAPIQVAWLGYPNTTGLATMDHRITDAIADPAPEADAHHTERLTRLAGGFLSYRPLRESPPPAGPAFLANGHVTFGSFNNISKLNDAVLRVWSRLLIETPTARLLIKSPRLDDPGTVERLRQRFAAAGADVTRLDIVPGRQSPVEHLAAYSAIDIALDPFPYNGTTTSFDALWMGVPVITLAGDRHAARVGQSILTGLGMGSLIARAPEEYLAIVRALAADPQTLTRWHGEIRGRLEASAFRDEAGFTARLEVAYEAMVGDAAARSRP